MSPEQAQLNNLDVDTRSDIYSLGVLLYELLTGTTPLEKQRFKEAAWDEIRRVIREEEPPRPSMRLSSAATLPSLAACRQTEPGQLKRQVRGDLDWIVMKALEKERSRRYETANGLALDVLRYLAGEPVLAAPPSATYRLRKLARKHRGVVLAASIVLVTLLLGIAGTTWGLITAQQAASAESQARESAEAEKTKAIEAARAERQAREQGQRRLAQIEKGVELFAGLLRGLNPGNEEKNGPPLYQQLRQRALKAADELVGEAVGDPETVARLQTLLGETLMSLGEAGKAVEVLERARATRQAKLGADHPDTLNTLSFLAAAYGTTGKLHEMITLLERIRDTQVKTLGPDHPDTLITLMGLAGAYRAKGRPEAIALFEEVRDAQIKKLGADHPDTLNTMACLAATYLAAGRQPEAAIALLEQVRDAQVKKLGAEHPQTFTTQTLLATAYLAVDRLPEALALLERIRDVQVKKLGVGHPDTLTTLSSLAAAYREANRAPEAITLLEQVRAAQMKKLGADHPSTLSTLSNLANAYREANRLPEAVTQLEQAKEFDKAEVWQREWIAAVKKQAGPQSPAYAGELAVLGLILLEQKKWTDAEAILQECLAIRQKTQPEAWGTFNAMSLLGGALLGQKQYAAAEPLLIKGFEGMKQRAGRYPPEAKSSLLKAADRLIALYQSRGQADQEAKWHKERQALESSASTRGAQQK
jgi:tetratricopeptide (TPR) repeat protein